MLKALIFDFDGLILDTETPEYLAWQNIYHEHGFELPIHEWGKIIGGSGHSKFDAGEHLTLLSQGRLDSATLRSRHQMECRAAVAREAVLPGVVDLIHAAKAHDLKLAIASSSPHSWVDNHAKRLGVLHYFDKVICSDDVESGRVKPNPDLFLSALNQLEIQKEAAVIFEDSPNGVLAANRAGIFVVAVPNYVTALLNLDGANLKIQSLADLPLSVLLETIK